MFNTNVEIKHTLHVRLFFFENRVVYEIWKNTGQPDRPQMAMAYTHCMLDTWGYKHTLRACNLYCFSIATMVAQTRLNVTLNVHCLSY